MLLLGGFCTKFIVSWFLKSHQNKVVFCIMNLLVSYRFLILFLVSHLLITFTSTARGENIVIPENNDATVNLSKKVAIAIDTNACWTIEQVRGKQEAFKKRSNNHILNFGMSSYAYWCKLEIENNGTNQYIKLENPVIDEVDLYFFDDSGLKKHKQSGASYTFNKRELDKANYLFALPEGNYTCYLRLKSNFNLQVPLKIASLVYFVEHEDITLIFYCGFMLAMILYNTFINVSMRDKSYVYYIFYIFFVTLSYASFKGIAFEYLWRNIPYMNFLIPSYSSITTVFMGLFVMSLLQTEKHTPKLSLGLRLFIIVFIICIIINLVGYYQVSAQISQAFTSLFALYLILVGVVSYKKGVKAAKFFLLAWTFYVCSIVVYILHLNGVVPYTVFTSNSVIYGSAVEAVLLSFALADRINTYKKEKLEAVQEKEVVLQERNVFLERQVNDRTIELQVANTELKRQALNAQIDPHFIFNALNSIQNFILKADKINAQKYLSKFAKLIRFQLNNSLNKAILLQDETAAIKAYLELEQVRFNTQFEFQINVETKKSQEKILFPTMLIIPFLENAIWHGVLPLRDRQGSIKIGIQEEGDKLSVDLS